VHAYVGWFFFLEVGGQPQCKMIGRMDECVYTNINSVISITIPYIHIYIYTYIYIYPSYYLPTYPSVYLPIYPSIHLSTHTNTPNPLTNLPTLQKHSHKKIQHTGAKPAPNRHKPCSNCYDILKAKPPGEVRVEKTGEHI